MILMIFLFLDYSTEKRLDFSRYICSRTLHFKPIIGKKRWIFGNETDFSPILRRSTFIRPMILLKHYQRYRPDSLFALYTFLSLFLLLSLPSLQIY